MKEGTKYGEKESSSSGYKSPFTNNSTTQNEGVFLKQNQKILKKIFLPVIRGQETSSNH